MAHTCCEPNRATQCRAHSVAADSRSFRDVAGMSRCSPPPKRPRRTCFPTPCRSCVRSVLERGGKDVRLEGGGVDLEVPEVWLASPCIARPSVHVASVAIGQLLCVIVSAASAALLIAQLGCRLVGPSHTSLKVWVWQMQPYLWAKFYTRPPPPTDEKTLLGVGGV